MVQHLPASVLRDYYASDWNSQELDQANFSPFQQGYEHDNENIELLRLRSFTIGKPVSDADLLSPDAQEKIATLIGIMEPFVSNPFTFI
jgi:uncharacterized protein (DUF2461 family)